MFLNRHQGELLRELAKEILTSLVGHPLYAYKKVHHVRASPKTFIMYEPSRMYKLRVGMEGRKTEKTISFSIKSDFLKIVVLLQHNAYQ